MDMLEHFIGEEVTVVTRIQQPVADSEGNVIMAPLTYSGLILDFDSKTILIQTHDLSVIAIDRPVAAVERSSGVAEAMEASNDPSKPPKDEMN